MTPTWFGAIFLTHNSSSTLLLELTGVRDEKKNRSNKERKETNFIMEIDFHLKSFKSRKEKKTWAMQLHWRVTSRYSSHVCSTFFQPVFSLRWHSISSLQRWNYFGLHFNSILGQEIGWRVCLSVMSVKWLEFLSKVYVEL